MSQFHSSLRYRGSLVSIADIRCRPSSPCASAEERANAHEVVFVRAGAFVRHSSNGSAVADSNHVLFFNRNEPYRVTHPAPGGDDCTSFTFSSEILRDVLSSCERTTGDDSEKPFRLSHSPIGMKTIMRQQQLRQRLRDPAVGALEIEESTLHLLNAVVKDAYRSPAQSFHAKRDDTSRLHAQWIDSVKLLIAQHAGSNLSLGEIARAVHCSPFHLARIFRASAGSSIHQYQLRLRLALSLERLAERPCSLTELALDLGFASHSHFTTAFQRTFGMSPSKFRRSARSACIRQMRKNLEVSFRANR